MTVLHLILIAPVHDEAAQVLQTLARVRDNDSAPPHASSIPVVSDASTDGIDDRVPTFSEARAGFLPVRIVPAGDKGHAAREGLLRAWGGCS